RNSNLTRALSASFSALSSAKRSLKASRTASPNASPSNVPCMLASSMLHRLGRRLQQVAPFLAAGRYRGLQVPLLFANRRAVSAPTRQGPRGVFDFKIVVDFRTRRRDFARFNYMVYSSRL